MYVYMSSIDSVCMYSKLRYVYIYSSLYVCIYSIFSSSICLEKESFCIPFPCHMSGSGARVSSSSLKGMLPLVER